LYIEKCLVVELKAGNEPFINWGAQLLTYMSLLKAPKGIIINFNSDNIFYQGQKTYVNEIYKNLKAL
jgi:GxxExxY protein